VFLVLPLALRDSAGLAASDHWMFYLPVLLLAIALMIPFVVIAEKRRKMKQIFVGAIAVLMLSQLGFYALHQSLWSIGLMLLLFFTAFNLLEATLPSLIAKVAPAEAKGTAMGVYSTSQFVGAFTGGFLGGWMHLHWGIEGVFLFGASATAIWLLVASGMAQPNYLSSHPLRVGILSPDQAQLLQARLLEIDGVGEACVVAEEGMAYLKVDLERVDMALLDKFSPAQG